MYTTLINADQLAPHVNDPNWVIVDCRHDLANPATGRAAYDAGHIPQAHFIHLDEELSGPKIAADGQFRGRHPLPERDKFIATLRRFGINNETQVIAYDAHGGMFAARLWWMLRWIGHPAAAVLNGGVATWEAAGQPLSTMSPVPSDGHIVAREPLAITVDADTVLSNLSQQLHIIIDARAPERFRGENETLDPVGGHIPGAKNRFFKDNLQANGLFKEADVLREEFSVLIHSANRTILQCGSGVTACHNLLAMEIADLSGASLYPGSWSEWCADRSRPVATGNQ